MKRFLFLACISSSLLISSCTTPVRIIDGRYHDPQGTYSFALPKMGSTQKIEEHKINQDADGISFQNDFGDLVRFEIAKFSHDELLSLSNELGGVENVLAAMFKDAVLLPISKQIPNTKVLDVNSEDIDGIGAVYFAMIDIPGGSTLEDAISHQRLDSRRGYLLSFCENYLVAISTQESPMIATLEKYGGMRMDRTKKIHDQLVEMRLSYKITNGISDID